MNIFFYLMKGFAQALDEEINHAKEKNEMRVYFIMLCVVAGFFFAFGFALFMEPNLYEKWICAFFCFLLAITFYQTLICKEELIEKTETEAEEMKKKEEKYRSLY